MQNRFMTSYITRFARSPAATFFLVFISGKRCTAQAVSLTVRTMATSREQPDQLKKISKNLIQNYRTKESVPVESLWADSDVGALTISRLKPVLDKNKVSLVGVGLEELGATEFMENKFFDGELYVDENKLCYQELGFRRFNLITVFKALLSAITRKALSEAREMNIQGNLKGDGLQNGGLLIVKKGGMEMPLFHVEQVPGDHVTNETILEILGISGDQVNDEVLHPTVAEEALAGCNEDACGVDAKPVLFKTKAKS